jgi:hypothetical protein
LHDVYLFSVLGGVAALVCALMLPARLRLEKKS